MKQDGWKWNSTFQCMQYIIINICFTVSTILIIYNTQKDIPNKYTIISDLLMTMGMFGLLYYQYLRKWYMGVICISVTLSSTILLLIVDSKKYLKHYD